MSISAVVSALPTLARLLLRWLEPQHLSGYRANLWLRTITYGIGDRTG